MKNIISDRAVKRRAYWIDEIRKLSGNFGDDSDRLEKELEQEIKKSGITALIDHLRLCGNIPESYGHDSSEEKLYSKYTNTLLSLSFKTICVFTYSHLSLLLTYSEAESKIRAQQLLLNIFQTIPALNPSKNAIDYWFAVNKTVTTHKVGEKPQKIK